MPRSRRDYAAEAEGLYVHIVDDEHAVLQAEVEARASDVRHPRASSHLDPHHLRNARSKHLRSRRLVETREVTKGGREIAIVTHPRAVHEARRTLRAAEDAAQRKRALEARYLGWAKGQSNLPSLVGRGGEWITQASLLRACQGSPVWAEQPGAELPSITELFGEPVPVGQIDNAAHLITPERQQVTLLIEVKNLRNWLYASDQEVFQVLSKAAKLQAAFPDRLFIPVIVCRRSQITLWRMAKDFGFYVIATFNHYIYGTWFEGNDVRQRMLQEVVTGLSYNLKRTTKPDDSIANHFGKTIPGVADEFSERWRTFGSVFGEQWEELRTEGEILERRRILAEIDSELSAFPHYAGGWFKRDEPEEPEDWSYVEENLIDPSDVDDDENLYDE